MKRIAIIVVLLAVIIGGYFVYVKPGIVSAGGPKFMTQAEFESVLQDSINVVWRDIESMKKEIETQNQKIDLMNERIMQLEQQ